MNINKSSQLEYVRRISRDQQLVAIETKKHVDIVSLQHRKLELEEEKVKMQRTHEEERILAIDLDSVPNERLRAYYTKLQEQIMNKL
jgi:hypothetical protein